MGTQLSKCDFARDFAYHFGLVIDWGDYHLWTNHRHHVNRWMCLRRWWFSANHCFGYYLGVVRYLSYYYSMMWRYLTTSYHWWLYAADDVGYSPTNYSWAMNWSAWPMALLLRLYKLLHLKKRMENVVSILKWNFSWMFVIRSNLKFISISNQIMHKERDESTEPRYQNIEC